MTECTLIDPLVTPYVDDDISVPDRAAIERHLAACRACRGRVHAERAVRALVHARQSAFADGAAPPPDLRARCETLARAADPSRAHAPAPGGFERPAGAGGWRARLVPFALAASLVLVVAGAFVYELTARSTQVMAAELTADHLKCFRVINNVLGTRHPSAAVESAMASSFDWQMRLPEHPERADLELVGARPCLYGEGRIAHIMYRHRGNPVSVFMLPKSAREEGLVEVMGHQAAIWSVGNRTFVLIAREPRDEVQRMSSFVHSALR